MILSNEQIDKTFDKFILFLSDLLHEDVELLNIFSGKFICIKQKSSNLYPLKNSAYQDFSAYYNNDLTCIKYTFLSMFCNHPSGILYTVNGFYYFKELEFKEEINSISELDIMLTLRGYV